MELKLITLNQFYQSEYNRNPWLLENFLLQKINLLVGKNATGKTRTLNIIATLANLLSGRRKELPGDHVNYKAEFEENQIKYVLEINYKNKKIYKERYRQGQRVLLKRHGDGKDSIYAEQLKRKIRFQVPEDKLACVQRRDIVQHSYFEKLYEWGDSLRYYKFGGKMGKNRFAIFQKEQDGLKSDDDMNPRDTEKAVFYLNDGIKKYGKKFKSEIKNAMKLMNYNIEDIGVDLSKAVKIVAPFEQSPYSLFIKEKDLQEKTTQLEISQGMFRAISLIIQINYSILGNDNCFILIDDVGEGLDFERSSALVKYLIKKIEGTKVRLLMSTNDRFIMNAVPLKYWSLIVRDGNICRIYNQKNSKKIFKEFEYTGLSNFDFLSTGFFKTGFEKK